MTVKKCIGGLTEPMQYSRVKGAKHYIASMQVFAIQNLKCIAIQRNCTCSPFSKYLGTCSLPTKYCSVLGTRYGFGVRGHPIQYVSRY